MQDLQKWFAAVTLVLSTGLAPALARDQLGTAGTLRSMGWAPCDQGIPAQFRGACDPAPVDPSLPAVARSNAEVERALKLISIVRLEQAREALDSAARIDPKNLNALKLRARLALTEGRADAEANVNAALLIAPGDSDLLATRAEILFNRRELEDALRDATEALYVNLRNADAFWIRARILTELDRLEAAENDLTRALAIEPDYTRALALRGEVRLRMTRFAEAVEDASLVLAQSPHNLPALQLRTMARTALGKYDDAIEDLTVVLGRPGEPTTAAPAFNVFNEMYVTRAILLVRVGRDQEALKDLDTIARLGGIRAILRMQVYLRNNGFPDLALDGKRSQSFDDALKACFVNEACGRGINQRS
jgi:tetratricopeptide (TPR) repeat protein